MHDVANVGDSHHASNAPGGAEGACSTREALPLERQRRCGALHSSASGVGGRRAQRRTRRSAGKRHARRARRSHAEDSLGPQLPTDARSSATDLLALRPSPGFLPLLLARDLGVAAQILRLGTSGGGAPRGSRRARRSEARRHVAEQLLVAFDPHAATREPSPIGSASTRKRTGTVTAAVAKASACSACGVCRRSRSPPRASRVRRRRRGGESPPQSRSDAT